MLSAPLVSYLIRLSRKYLLQHLFSNTSSPCFSRSVRDKVSHPYKITVKIIVLISDYNLELSTLQLGVG